MNFVMIYLLIDVTLAIEMESLSLNSVPVYDSEPINWGTHIFTNPWVGGEEDYVDKENYYCMGCIHSCFPEKITPRFKG